MFGSMGSATIVADGSEEFPTCTNTFTIDLDAACTSLQQDLGCFEDLVNACKIGRSEAVARAGASSVLV
mgnify:CR=1 FL=1